MRFIKHNIFDIIYEIININDVKKYYVSAILIVFILGLKYSAHLSNCENISFGI